MGLIKMMTIMYFSSTVTGVTLGELWCHFRISVASFCLRDSNFNSKYNAAEGFNRFWKGFLFQNVTQALRKHGDIPF